MGRAVSRILWPSAFLLLLVAGTCAARPVREFFMRGAAEASPGSPGRQITVSNSAEVRSALASAKGGETLLLKPGVYSGLAFNDLTFAMPVTLTSSEPGARAQVTDFIVRASGGLTFRNLDLHANVYPGLSAFAVFNSHDITFDNDSIHGSMDGDPQNDQDGIGFLNSRNIAVTNCEFQELGIGFQSGSGTNVLLSGNYMHNLRVDAMELADNHNVRILNNFFSDFHIKTGDHPDAIQFWTDNVAGSTDVTISGNVITRGGGNVGQQGIFFDDLHKVGYKRIAISNNLLIGTGFNGIAIMGAESAPSEGITITDNELWSIDNDNAQTWIRLEHTTGAVVRGNKSFSLIFPAGSNASLSEKENKKVSPVGRKEAGPAKDWLSRHPEMSWVQQHLR
jgi:hypothetical protein